MNCKRMTAFCLALFVTTSAVAQALTAKEMRNILLTGTPAEADAALQQLEQDVVSGKKPIYARGSPYSALGRLDPKVHDFIARWRAERPNSAFAKLAEAKMHYSIGMIVRGYSYVQETPPTSMAIMYERYAKAKRLLLSALETLPDNIEAANMLDTIGQFTGDREARRRANEILARLESPESRFRGEIHDLLPQWGGSLEAAKRHCREEGPKVGVNVEVCQARVVLLAYPRPGGIDEALETLQREEPTRYVGLKLQTLLDLGRGEEAMALVRKYDYWVGASDAKRLGVLLKDPQVILDLTGRWLEITPLQPNVLTAAAEAYNYQGKRAEAIAAIDKAMVFGRTLPKVRAWQLNFAFQDPKKRERIFEIIWEAMDDTGWHYDIYHQVMHFIAGPSEEITHFIDGRKKTDFHCNRAAFLSALPEVCAYWRNRGTYCRPKPYQRITKIVEGLDTSSCK